MLRPIFFDLETTGITIRSDRITEIGAFDPWHDKHFQSFVNPKIPIPKESSAINGITDDMVSQAPTLEKVLDDFFTFCEGEILLIAHNGNFFDFPFLHNEVRRIGMKLPDHWHGLDSLIWARKYRKDLPRHSLQYLRQIFHIPENRAHRALDDCKTLANLFSLMTDDLTIEEIIERGDGRKLSEILKETTDSQTTTKSDPTLFAL